MRNKSFVVFLTLVISLLCLYYLSFTWVAAHVRKKALVYATDEAGNIDFAKQQAYLEDVWKKPVYKLLGSSYTYEEVKENELKLGLDLQGGMHVTLEISPGALLKSLAGGNKSETFLQALAEAQTQKQLQPTVAFTKLFYTAYQTLCPGEKLSDIFATSANRQYITYQSSDREVLQYIEAEMKQAVDRSFEILRARLDRFGTLQPTIQQLPGTGRIQIELPGVHEPKRVRNLLQGVAQLRFWEVYDFKEVEGALEAVNTLLLAEEKAAAKPTDLEKDLPATEPEQPAMSILFRLLKGSYGLAYPTDQVPTIQRILDRADVKALLPNDLIWLWDVKPHTTQEGIAVLGMHPIKQKRSEQPLLEGDVITDARQVFDERGQPAVTMQMNSLGARAWKNITAQSIGKSIAIALDNHVYSAPVVQSEIPNGHSQITGHFTIEEAKDLANILKAGSLPAPVSIVEEAIIGPTLGKEAQIQGITSMLIGLLLVVLFMLIYYAKGGVIANLALLFNIVFILGILAQLEASLTLPGIAGIVLTIGMSIDANVLIFERIREELKAGAMLKVAIQQGYEKAYSSIIDANVTTFLTGAILYVLGQGPVRGFATILMIGIVTSVFTAVFITRVIISEIVRKNPKAKLTFSFAITQNLFNNFQINFLGYRRYFYTISLLFIGLGFGCLLKQKGLNLGVDFTGGRSYVVALSQPVEATHIKTQLAEYFDNQGTEVKTFGANHIIKVTTSYLMQHDTTETDEQVKAALLQGMTHCTGLRYQEPTETLNEGTFTLVSTAKVGATMAGATQSASQRAILLSLIMIFLYITLRFRKWRFGLAAVVALLHDSLAVLAAFAIARALGYAYEVDQVFIAALLTIIGYSINDTVVVFDRIRERSALQKEMNFVQLANRSINETLSRTLITSITTLIAVVTLLIFGGAVLRGFAFVLFIGIIFGTYSSICIATPLVLDLARWKDKKAAQ